MTRAHSSCSAVPLRHAACLQLGGSLQISCRNPPGKGCPRHCPGAVGCAHAPCSKRWEPPKQGGPALQSCRDAERCLHGETCGPVLQALLRLGQLQSCPGLHAAGFGHPPRTVIKQNEGPGAKPLVMGGVEGPVGSGGTVGAQVEMGSGRARTHVEERERKGPCLPPDRPSGKSLPGSAQIKPPRVTQGSISEQRNGRKP